MSETTLRTRRQARQEGSPPEFQELQPQHAAPRKSKKKQKQQQPSEGVGQPDENRKHRRPEATEGQSVSREEEAEAAETSAPSEQPPAPQPQSAENAGNDAGEEETGPQPFKVAVRGSAAINNSLDTGNSLSTESESALADMQAAMREYDDPEGLTIGNRHFDCVEDYVRFMASLPVDTFESFLRSDKMAVGRAETYLSIRKVWNSFVMEHAQKIGR
ncbi:hypothetical protein KEM55_000259 [Ascosphaera atra]|nr:hypothetical protein KEM55_000259 [Ascosphaera atra]